MTNAWPSSPALISTHDIDAQIHYTFLFKLVHCLDNSRYWVGQPTCCYHMHLRLHAPTGKWTWIWAVYGDNTNKYNIIYVVVTDFSWYLVQFRASMLAYLLRRTHDLKWHHSGHSKRFWNQRKPLLYNIFEILYFNKENNSFLEQWANVNHTGNVYMQWFI